MKLIGCVATFVLGYLFSLATGPAHAEEWPDEDYDQPAPTVE